MTRVYVKRRVLSSLPRGDMRAGGCGREGKCLVFSAPPSFLSSSAPLLSLFVVRQVPPGAHGILLPISASWYPGLPTAEDSWHRTFNLADVQIEDRTKPIGFSLN